MILILEPHPSLSRKRYSPGINLDYCPVIRMLPRDTCPIYVKQCTIGDVLFGFGCAHIFIKTVCPNGYQAATWQVMFLGVLCIEQCLHTNNCFYTIFLWLVSYSTRSMTQIHIIFYYRIYYFLISLIIFIILCVCVFSYFLIVISIAFAI